jgi:hypothetical protein
VRVVFKLNLVYTLSIPSLGKYHTAKNHRLDEELLRLPPDDVYRVVGSFVQGKLMLCSTFQYSFALQTDCMKVELRFPMPPRQTCDFADQRVGYKITV